jgi:hypothetical protein
MFPKYISEVITLIPQVFILIVDCQKNDDHLKAPSSVNRLMFSQVWKTVHIFLYCHLPALMMQIDSFDTELRHSHIDLDRTCHVLAFAFSRYSLLSLNFRVYPCHC